MPVLAATERRGLYVDLKKLAPAVCPASGSCARRVASIHQTAGEFQLRLSDPAFSYLVDVLKLPTYEFSKKDTNWFLLHQHQRFWESWRRSTRLLLMFLNIASAPKIRSTYLILTSCAIREISAFTTFNQTVVNLQQVDFQL